MEPYFPPGIPDDRPFPLKRYLPPLPAGAVSSLLSGIEERACLDVFGSSPQLLVEAAASGCGVLVSSANPVLRFLITHTARPFRRETLQMALTRLGNLPKDGGRLEQFLQELYRSRCEHCGAAVHVDRYIWEVGNHVPSYKQYRCSNCLFEGEILADVEDARLAAEMAGHPQHREMVLARVAPPGDPYRQYAEEALAVYSPRALTALDVLLNKLAQLQIEDELSQAVRALLLTTLDRATMLWSHPIGSRPRPRQLSLSPRFYEHNVWNALLDSVDLWALPDPGVEISSWEQDRELTPGTIHVYSGSARRLLQETSTLPPLRILSALPRPNQAFWSLSALWSCWLFEEAGSCSFKRSLVRRRYDWQWYAHAVQSALTGLGEVSGVDPALALILEAEPSFTGAVYAGFCVAGFFPVSSALHSDTKRSILLFSSRAESPLRSGKEREQSCTHALEAVLRQRGEPADFFTLMETGQRYLAAQGLIAGQGRGQHEDAADLLTAHQELLEKAIQDREIFIRLDSHLELESGVYWLKDPAGARTPLGDRVENLVRDLVSERGAVEDPELLELVFREFVSGSMPEERLVELCVEAYTRKEGNLRVLLPEEETGRREEECEVIRQALVGLGERSGCIVETGQQVCWHTGQNQAWTFYVSAAASLEPLLRNREESRVCVVCPGSRSRLVLERMRRDVRLDRALESGARVLKFRHVYRLAEDGLPGWEDIEAILDLDPIEQRDPQIPLF